MGVGEECLGVGEESMGVGAESGVSPAKAGLIVKSWSSTRSSWSVFTLRVLVPSAGFLVRGLRAQKHASQRGMFERISARGLLWIIEEV